MTMMTKTAFKAIVLALAVTMGNAAHGEDYLASPPLTSYEETEITPQNADFDATNNMFVAHPGWLNNKEVSYYKFNIYSPPRYPGVISGPPDMSTSADVPVQDIYFTTTTGDFSGVVGKPILQYHHVDGVAYSDFMRVNFITVPGDYVPNTIKSLGDVNEEGYIPIPADIILNLPVVPTGSTLQHPVTKETTKAPIDPFMVYYKGQEVTTYVFEVTDQAAKDYFDPITRSDGNNDFAIHVTPFNTSPTSVFAIPLWHVNQYTRGVMTGQGGGPSPDGMRNIIAADRGDPGYSPLWQLYWLTEMPINYEANQVSHQQDMTAENGFVWATTPMFVNCPNIGPVGDTENPLQTDSFETKIDPSRESNWILGTHGSLIFEENQVITIKAVGESLTSATKRSTISGDGVSETTLGTIKTNGMGAFEYELMSKDIPEGTEKIKVVLEDGSVIQEIEVLDTTEGDESIDKSAAAPKARFLVIGMIATIAAVFSI